MNFKKCTQLEINGKVFDCKCNYPWFSILCPIYGWFDTPIEFLKSIGAKPVLNIPRDGDPVWVKGIKSRKWQLMVATGRFNGEQIETYPCTSEEPIEKFYMGWKYWKPFNPKELKREGNK